MQTVQKNIFNNKNRWVYSLWIFNIKLLGIWSHRWQACFILWKRLYEIFLQFCNRACKKYNWFCKETNVTINRRKIKIISRYKSMLNLWKKNLKKLSKNINYYKVRYHCHYTVKYRGAAHRVCNSKFNLPEEITVVFHNDSKYDYHFIST